MQGPQDWHCSAPCFLRRRRRHRIACPRLPADPGLQAAHPKVCVYTIALNEKKHVQDFMKHSKVRSGSVMRLLTSIGNGTMQSGFMAKRCLTCDVRLCSCATVSQNKREKET